eukprot:9503818-Pyramimonas_sp.AAC.2
MTILILASAPEARVTATADPRSNDQNENFHFESDHTFDNDDEPAVDDMGMFAGALEAAVTTKKTAKKKGKQRARVPKNKKGPLAFENAAREPPVSRTSLGSGALEVPLRLLVHAVQDDTNVSYIKEVEPFFAKVRLKRLPFATAAERDAILAAELDNLCFVERASVPRGVRLYHGLVHLFPEWKPELPISLRALHSWEKSKSRGKVVQPLQKQSISSHPKRSKQATWTKG